MKSIQHVMLAIGVIIIALVGCNAQKTIWSAEVKSSDGAWLARAHTDNIDGPGINAQYTIVEMQQTFPNARPVEVLELDEGTSAVRDLRMNWISPSHLDITYRGNPEILFQAVIAFEKTVTVEHLPN